MESIREIFRIGDGPSSSHTMAPKKAATQFLEKNPDAKGFRVTLYGSLSLTGRGHMTDVAILSVLGSVAPTEIVWEKIFLPFHPNGMKFEALDSEGGIIDEWTIYSIGGGALANETIKEAPKENVYPMNTIAQIQKWCEDSGKSYWECVEEFEGKEIWEHLSHTWSVMKSAIERGLNNEGVLPGGLGLRRKAGDYMIRAKTYGDWMRSRGMLYAYALAVSEENASGGEIVTAPTCGSCGVLPAVLYHLQNTHDFVDVRILRALATAGLFGSVVRANASVSGAEVGCQGEVGVACAMAAAAANQLGLLLL